MLAWLLQGVLRCTVDTKAGPLRLANTHLVARYTAHGDEEGDEFTGELQLCARSHGAGCIVFAPVFLLIAYCVHRHYLQWRRGFSSLPWVSPPPPHPHPSAAPLRRDECVQVIEQASWQSCFLTRD